MVLELLKNTESFKVRKCIFVMRDGHKPMETIRGRLKLTVIHFEFTRVGIIIINDSLIL